MDEDINSSKYRSILVQNLQVSGREAEDVEVNVFRALKLCISIKVILTAVYTFFRAPVCKIELEFEAGESNNDEIRRCT